MEQSLKIPTHIGFIMDGNGRWATQRGLSRSEGHRQGAEALKKVVKACSQKGIKVVSIYAFSCENWSKRPQAEIKFLFSLITQFVKKEMKENFYHGILLGLFGNMDGWNVQSNAESGDGYSDISIEIEEQETGIVIELKYAENASFDAACREAMKQINDRNYGEKLIDDGMKIIRKYGIACYKRRCKVISG